MRTFVAALMFVSVAYGAIYNVGHSDKEDEPSELPSREVPAKPKHRAAQEQPSGPVGPLKCTDPATQKLIVDEHNRLRRIPGASDMQKISWDNDAAALAQKWADRCGGIVHPAYGAESDQFLKTKKYRLGQNIAYWPGDIASWNFTINKQWYSEIKDFKYGQETNAMIGHYTQIVWANTFTVGCGVAECPSKPPVNMKHRFFVCNYGTPGNYYDGKGSQFKPWTNGAKCGQCKNKCDNGLCTNPCPLLNAYNNCEGEGALMKGRGKCDKNDQNYNNCKATCQCPADSIVNLAPVYPPL